jgi:spore maturation protein CgeB
MNIAFFGSSLLSAYWNGAATYYRGIVHALARRGHRTTFYEPDAFGRQQHRDLDPPDWAEVVVYSAEGTDEVRRALAAAATADLIVKASGVGVFDDLLEQEVLLLKQPRNIVAYWDVDAHATLQRVAQNPSDPFRPLIKNYDLVLTYGGGEPVVSAYRELGARACVPVYNALDPRTHFPVAPDPRFAATLGFLGNRLPDREARVRDFFFVAAELLPAEAFLLGGNGWQDHVACPTNVRRLGHVYTRDHNAFNCTPRAVLNISRQGMADFGFSPATRVFEAAGAGACIITDEWLGIDQFLEPEREILIASSGHQVAEHLQRLQPARTAEIGRRAARRILAEHTYDHRSAQLEDLFGISRQHSKGTVEHALHA